VKAWPGLSPNSLGGKKEGRDGDRENERWIKRNKDRECPRQGLSLCHSLFPHFPSFLSAILVPIESERQRLSEIWRCGGERQLTEMCQGVFLSHVQSSFSALNSYDCAEGRNK